MSYPPFRERQMSGGQMSGECPFTILNIGFNAPACLVHTSGRLWLQRYECCSRIQIEDITIIIIILFRTFGATSMYNIHITNNMT